MSDPTTTGPLNVQDVMAEVRARVRADVRTRLVRQGAVEFESGDVFDEAERLLQDALRHRDGQGLLLPELLDDEDAWRLDPALRLSSHRPVTGGLIVWTKRRILLPVMRWLFDYSRENFARQERLNLVLMAVAQRLAVDNARLAARLDALERRTGTGAS